MGKGISEVLTYAVGVAISPVPIIAVTLMLFSRRARVNGLMFLLGWVVALAVISGFVYVAADQANAATDSTTSDTIAWGKIVLGVLFLLLAARNWRTRPAARRREREGPAR
jgi:protein-S-isoprenylcysteine O-methyltransferase Ste14